MNTTVACLFVALLLMAATVLSGELKSEEYDAEMAKLNQRADEFFLTAEESGLNVTLKVGRRRRSSLRRCGGVFLKWIRVVCNHCIGRNERGPVPDRSIYDVCCKDGCNEQYIRDRACCE